MILTCPVCGALFKRKANYLRKFKPPYRCSTQCRYDDLEKRIWNRVNKTESCWLWTGAHRPAGYGKILIRGKYKCAHRVVWEIMRGPIPEGMEVCHSCDVPACVNPSHLFIGTRQDNVDDCVKKKRHSCGSRHAFSKIDESDVKLIRGLFADGEHFQWELAEQFGISQISVSRIVNRKSWTHVI